MDYVQQMEEKLQAARTRVKQGRQFKALKAGAPAVIEIIDGEISLELNRGYGSKPLTYEEYLESHGAVRGIRRIRDVMNSKEAEEIPAANEVEAIQDNIKLVKDGKK